MTARRITDRRTRPAPEDPPPALRAPALSDMSGIGHGFFGRRGGSSAGLYAALNCGLGSDDAPDAVAANRILAARALGVPANRLVTLYQIHSAEAVVVRTPWTREQTPRADAMATREAGLALGVLAADCAPVLFADAEARVIGAAHAGWKGAFGGVLEAAIDAMERLGARRARIRAAIGPCISQANYEVGPEFRDRFVAAEAPSARFFLPAERALYWHFDLPGYVRARLTAAGVAAWAGEDCTYADESGYFSYRRATHRGEADYGRNLSAIVLTDPR